MVWAERGTKGLVAVQIRMYKVNTAPQAVQSILVSNEASFATPQNGAFGDLAEGCYHLGLGRDVVRAAAEVSDTNDEVDQNETRLHTH